MLTILLNVSNSEALQWEPYQNKNRNLNSDRTIIDPVIVFHLPRCLHHQQKLFDVGNSSKDKAVLGQVMAEHLFQDAPLLESPIVAFMSSSN